MEDHLAGIRTASALLILCVLATIFGFPYMFPLAGITAVYAFYKSKELQGLAIPHPNAKSWKIIGWIAVLIAGVLIVNTLFLQPVKAVETNESFPATKHVSLR